APTDLPEPGEAGLDEHATRGATVVRRDLAGERRARADEAHVAAQDVEELRQLVEGVAAQQPAERGDARVVAQLEQRARALVEVGEVVDLSLRAHTHRAELDHA